MKARISYQLFTQTQVDSGSLTCLGSIIHGFPDEGEYVGQVLRGDETLARFRLTVSSQSSSMQTDIDLAALHELGLGRPKKTRGKQFSVSQEGFVVFYVSHGRGGYSVRVFKRGQEAESPVFDNLQLTQGDLFTVTLLHPGKYSLVNTASAAKGEIKVSYPKVEPKPPSPAEPVPVECLKDAFKPPTVQVRAAQTLTFQIKTPSRIVIELVESDSAPEEAGQPKKLFSWNKAPSSEEA